MGDIHSSNRIFFYHNDQIQKSLEDIPTFPLYGFSVLEHVVARQYQSHSQISFQGDDVIILNHNNKSCTDVTAQLILFFIVPSIGIVVNEEFFNSTLPKSKSILYSALLNKVMEYHNDQEVKLIICKLEKDYSLNLVQKKFKTSFTEMNELGDKISFGKYDEFNLSEILTQIFLLPTCEIVNVDEIVNVNEIVNEIINFNPDQVYMEVDYEDEVPAVLTSNDSQLNRPAPF